MLAAPLAPTHRFVGVDLRGHGFSDKPPTGYDLELTRARAGHGQVAAVIGEPGMGKSRLVWELTHAEATQGWLILESSAVSHGRATLYLPRPSSRCFGATSRSRRATRLR